MTSACAVLMATKDRCGLLFARSLPSVRKQTTLPSLLVIVNDGIPFPPEGMASIRSLLIPVSTVIADNVGLPGAAGAWNSGLAYLRNAGFDGFVAILDDDDEWDEEHLQISLSKAQETGAELVVSGLRRVVDGRLCPRALPNNLTDRDFLWGNPGLQGSNLFVSFSALERAGGFTNGLQSLNDRDLAIRLFRLADLCVAYTGRWTASWNQSVSGQALSAPRSPAKIAGLRQFWRIYGPEMTVEETSKFFDRALHLFGVTRPEIV